MVEVLEEGPSWLTTTRSVRLRETIETTIKYTTTTLKNKLGRKRGKTGLDEANTSSHNDKVDPSDCCC